MTGQHFDAVVFDAYGTLLNVHAAMARHAKHLGSNWQALATEWRIKQLEYSWIDNMTVHRARRDFAACTADALDYVLARHAIDGGLRSELLSAYERLDAYAEVPTMLATLRCTEAEAMPAAGDRWPLARALCAVDGRDRRPRGTLRPDRGADRRRAGRTLDPTSCVTAIARFCDCEVRSSRDDAMPSYIFFGFEAAQQGLCMGGALRCTA